MKGPCSITGVLAGLGRETGTPLSLTLDGGIARRVRGDVGPVPPLNPPSASLYHEEALNVAFARSSKGFTGGARSAFPLPYPSPPDVNTDSIFRPETL